MLLLLFLPITTAWLLSEYTLDRVNLLTVSPTVLQTQPYSLQDELIAIANTSTGLWHITAQHTVLLNDQLLYTLPYEQLAEGVLAVIGTIAYTLAWHQGRQLLLVLDSVSYTILQLDFPVDGLLVYDTQLLALSNGRLQDLETGQTLWQTDRLPAAGNAFRNCITDSKNLWPLGSGNPLAEYCELSTVGYGTESFSVLIVNSDNTLTFQPGQYVQYFATVQLRGKLELDLSGVDVADGTTLTLFYYSSLSGSFDDISIIGYTQDCGRVEAETEFNNGEARAILKVLTDSCYSLGKASRLF